MAKVTKISECGWDPDDHVFGDPPKRSDELPDARLPKARREKLKLIVASCEDDYSDEELMYLACAFDDAAHKKRQKGR